MRFIADLHIHSHYSRATSPEMNIVSLTKWSQLKGTHVIGTGDFTHPRWFAELQEKLESAEAGLFRLKPQFEKEIAKDVYESCRNPMRFVLSVEISSIYKKNGRVRKVHSLVFAPSFQDVAKINTKLGAIGNIRADGRPILGLDAKELLKIVLDVNEKCMLIPAHAWTPHFSVFGSESGFDSLEEAFDELTPHIYAIETGLSSDPAMNWRLSKLDNIALISNSDAHSAPKLGREANIFNTDMSYPGIMNALTTNDMKAFESTIEFFPEEGKYHLDGHRLCGVRLEPAETRKRNFLCPKCGKPLTVGVLHRVEKLADRPPGFKPVRARPFRNIIPLQEIIAETEGVGTASKRVQALYLNLLRALGSEFFVLLEAPLKDIERESSPLLAEAIRRVREGAVRIAGGFDGEYGTVKIFEESERARFASASSPQSSLF
jgi:uncharacterized protein (TIGR00375 family)